MCAFDCLINSHSFNVGSQVDEKSEESVKLLKLTAASEPMDP